MRNKPEGEVVGKNRVQTVESLQMKLKGEVCILISSDLQIETTPQSTSHARHFFEILKVLKNIIYQIKK